MQRFIDNGDNTVTDTKTGLVWTKKTIAKNVDYHHGAERAPGTLGDGWRLPTVEELSAISDRTRHEPAIDTDAFPDTENDWYWTSTPCSWRPTSAVWVVDFLTGSILDLHRHDGACVRAVRAGQ